MEAQLDLFTLTPSMKKELYRVKPIPAKWTF